MLEKVTKTNLLTHDFITKLEECSKTFLPTNAADIRLQDFCSFGRSGVSSLMYAFYLSYMLEGLDHKDSIILRVYNKGFEESGFREFTLLKKLKEKNVDVPKVYFFKANDDTLKRAFMIMERIEGCSAASFLGNEEYAMITIDNMAKALNEVHKLNPRVLQEFDILKRKFEIDQDNLLKTIEWIKKSPISLFRFLPPYQKRLIIAVKRLDNAKPQNVQLAVLHNDYEPNHVLCAKGRYTIIDWHMAAIGDPRFDVANTYHELELFDSSCDIDLGNHFVKCYERYNGRKLENLEFFKTMTAMKFAHWFLLLPFEPDAKSVFTNMTKYSFFIGHIGYLLRRRRLQQSLNRHHSSYQRPVEYFQNYVVRYLEKAGNRKTT